MSEETKTVDQPEQEPKATEFSEQDLDKVAGGGALADAISNVFKPVKPSGGGQSSTSGSAQNTTLGE